jgi:hypothetical protein
MPVIIVDTEQAALMETAFVMLEAALTARVERADPEKIVSNSLALQAAKLKTVRALLKMPDPPEWLDLSDDLKRKALHICASLADTDEHRLHPAYWRTLRGIINAPAFPPA